MSTVPLAPLQNSQDMPPLNPPESYRPPSTYVQDMQTWHECRQAMGDGKGRKTSAIGECTTPRPLASWIAHPLGSKKTLFIHPGSLKPEHRHWPRIQTFPIELVRQVVDNMLKVKEARGDLGQPHEENEDVRLNGMD